MYSCLILRVFALSLVTLLTPIISLSQPASGNQLTQDSISSGVQLAHHGDRHGGHGSRHGGCGW